MKMKSGLLLPVSDAALPAPAKAANSQTFLRDFYAACKGRDAARLARVYTSDATFVDRSFELNLKGPEQIRDLFNQVLPKYETLGATR